jgi:two-component system chemotaxis sensor kinase CheA
MDVVRSNIEKIGGSVDLSSQSGKGSLFRIKIPLTLAIVSVLLVEAAKQKFAIPQANVNELVYAHKSAEYRIELVNDAPVLRLRDKLLSLIDLSSQLGMNGTYNKDSDAGVYVVVCNAGGCDFGVIVDRVFDTEEIVVKPLAPVLQGIDMYSGCTILGDGSVIVILDPNTLAREAGQISVGQVVRSSEAQHLAFADRKIKFLLFHAGDGTPKAVPLDLVSRLEEIEPARIEKSSGMNVVQYLGGLMLLTGLGEEIGEPREGGLYPVVVFQYDKKTVGLVIDDIIDVVEESLDIKMASKNEIFIGSMVIDGRATDVVDVGCLVSRVIGDFASTGTGNDKRDKKTILVVDDSKFFRNVSAPYLSAQGFEVLTAEGPSEAFEIMQDRQNVDLIISDIEMPDMSGIDFARKCKTIDKYRNVPMIAFTSKMTSESVREGLEAGFRAYLSKTDRDGLVREVAQLLS